MTISNKTKIALAVAVFLWASAFVGIRAGLRDYSPEGLALLRFIIASICMGIVYYRLPRKTPIHLFDLCCLMGIGGIGIGVYNVCLNRGEISISSGMASFIIGQSPMITTLFALLFLGEKLNFLRVMGFIVSIMGIALISIGEIGGFKWDPGLNYIFIATLTGGFYTLLQKPFLKKYHAIEATTFIIWGGALFLLMYTPLLQENLMHASLQSTLVVIYLGIFPAAVGYIAWAYALSEIPASRAVSFLYFMPFLATIIGWLYLGEVPALMSIAGGLLAIMGVWLVNHSYARLPVPQAAVN